MSVSDKALDLYTEIFQSPVPRGVVAHVVQPLIFRALLTDWDIPNVSRKVGEQKDELHRATLIELDKCLEIIEEMFDG